jgi:hypothetical protein
LANLLGNTCESVSFELMLAYFIIIATSVLGYVGAPWWSLLGGAATLAVLGNRELQPLRPRFQAIGASYLLENAVHARVAHSMIAAAIAFGWGALIRLALGG